MERTKDYVDTQSFEQHASSELENAMPLQLTPYDKISRPSPPSFSAVNTVYKSFQSKNYHQAINCKRHTVPSASDSPVTPHTSTKHQAATQNAPVLVQYLMRKEMVSSGLLPNDDRPENYWAWKSSFLAATRDLNLSDQEELNLLIKWLGPNSSAQAMRIRSVHVNNPRAGVFKVWQWLEVIENALLEKLESFPVISNKEAHKLRDLGDFLRELDTAKSEGVLPGLTYLNTARGVNPIVEKLPVLEPRWPSGLRRWFANATPRETGFRIPPLPRAEFGRLKLE